MSLCDICLLGQQGQIKKFHRQEMKPINEGGGGKRDDLHENIRREKEQIYLATLEIIKKGSNNVFC